MASFEQRGNSVRAIVSFKDGKKTATFDTMGEARAWAAIQEHSKKTGTANSTRNRTVENLLLAYLPIAENSDTKKWNRLRILKFCDDPLAKVQLSEITPHDINEWISRRLKEVKPATVQRELNLWGAAFTYGIKTRKWITDSPCHEAIKLPKTQARHRPLLKLAEIQAIAIATGYARDPLLLTKIARTGACFLLSMETAIRSGEMLRIRPQDYDRDARVVYIHAMERGGRKGSKSGTLLSDRTVPLTARAIELLDQLLATMPIKQVPIEGFSMPPYIVGLNDSQRDTLWRKGRDRSGVSNLTFHDMKHEAATRLARFIDVIALSHAIGTKDLKLLRDTYYNNDAQRIAMSLPEQLNDYGGIVVRSHQNADHCPPISELDKRSSAKNQLVI